MKYQGERSIDSLSAFVTEHTGIAHPQGEEAAEGKEVEEGGQQGEQQGEEKEEVDGAMVDESGLVHLTDGNFQHFISDKSGLHFVKFYAPW